MASLLISLSILERIVCLVAYLTQCSLALIYPTILVVDQNRDVRKKPELLDPEDEELIIDVDAMYPDKKSGKPGEKPERQRLSFLRKGLFIDSGSSDARKPTSQPDTFADSDSYSQE